MKNILKITIIISLIALLPILILVIPFETITEDISSTNNESAEKKDFVFAFYSEVAKENNDLNLFFSPFSISTAFSMAYEGTTGNTASEMQ